MKPGFKLIFITLPVLAIGVGVLALIVSNRPPPARVILAERATAVRVITTQASQLPPRITGYGLVRPSRVYEAIAQVAGTADYVNPNLEKGEILPAGTVLLRLSQTDFNLGIAQAKANIRAGEAKLAELTVTQLNQIAALDIESRALEIRAREIERIETLTVRGIASAVAMDAAQSSWLLQSQKVQTLINTLSLLPTQQQVQTEQIAVYETSLKSAELDLARTTLTLPFAARVAQTSVEIGQFVRVGQVAAELDGVGSAEIEAQVSISDMLALLRSRQPQAERPKELVPGALSTLLHSLGLNAEVHLRLGEQVLTWPAKVDRISDQIDLKSGTVGVIVRVDSAYTGVRPGTRPPLTKGMFVDVELSAPPLDGIVIPRSALRNGRVFLADADNRLASTPVTTRLMQDEVALITQDLPVGARIVVSFPSPAMEGMLLDVTNDLALEAQLARAGQQP
ncbi:efflux RND transporter periplasmic adaptor subunit [Parasedimentitalea psychrophila]|uniref:HlyD family efflux transporter periplasmic adaptor subunit n=1 Tax=Parasedimentitalea psychrophila TaxID=2997337 RepID=A0A9Y2KYH1_9RHOB|nr:hypothetical protein [Parasedimentitalea psychrophila]WIY24774.1 hypothetical protein QPJ95_20020 [Parasedimentitalea psychrophila]